MTLGISYKSNEAVHFDGRVMNNRHMVTFGRKKAWLTLRSFQAALALAVAAKTVECGWLGVDGLGGFKSYHQVIRRLKQDIQDAGADPSLIENSRAKQYRLSLPPQNISIDAETVSQHVPNADKALSALSMGPRDLPDTTLTRD